MRAPKPSIDQAPGLRWQPRADHWVGYWVARSDLVKKGYPTKTQRLWPPTQDAHAELTEDTETYLRSECQRLQDEMLAWAKGGDTKQFAFDGTLSSLIECYRRDPDSTFQALRIESKRTYNNHFKIIERSVGKRDISGIEGRDFLRWFENWSAPPKEGKPRRVPRAHAAITMLRLVFSFGKVLNYGRVHCTHLKGILEEMQFESGRPRVEELTAAHAVAIRAEAHARGFPSIAFAQAMQFELMLRQKDVIGAYVPVGEPGLSDVHRGRRKWQFGIDWREVSKDLILTHRLSKSLRGRRAIADPDAGKTKVYDLKLYPMVMEDLASIPPERRVGPIIIDERTGLPYTVKTFIERWRKIATAAGVPKSVQNRDSRAGGITEGIEATDGDIEAARIAAGHSQITTTQKYSRGDTRRTAKLATLRAAKRPVNGNSK